MIFGLLFLICHMYFYCMCNIIEFILVVWDVVSIVLHKQEMAATVWLAFLVFYTVTSIYLCFVLKQQFRYLMTPYITAVTHSTSQESLR